MRRYVLFDHDGVLVDTEPWYFAAGQRALADIGVHLDRDRYLADMADGLGTWTQARAAGVDETAIGQARRARDAYYQQYLRSEAIEIDGVLDVLAGLAPLVRMAVVTTAKRADLELIHRDRTILSFMQFVLAREDYTRAKPDPEPYLTALRRFGAPASETLVVEDSARGLASAVAAGIDCAVVHNDFTATQDFTRARYRIASLAELIDIVRADQDRPAVRGG